MTAVNQYDLKLQHLIRVEIEKYKKKPKQTASIMICLDFWRLVSKNKQLQDLLLKK